MNLVHNGRETRSVCDTASRLVATIDNCLNRVAETGDRAVTDDATTGFVGDGSGLQTVTRHSEYGCWSDYRAYWPCGGRWVQK